MNKDELQQALNQANDRKQAQLGANVVAFILAIAYAYFSPSGWWFHGENIGWSNVILFFVIYAAIFFGLDFIIDKADASKRR